MTGPEHYRRAEQLLEEAALNQGPLYVQENVRKLAAAQVHATLAQVVATTELHREGAWKVMG